MKHGRPPRVPVGMRALHTGGVHVWRAGQPSELALQRTSAMSHCCCRPELHVQQATLENTAQNAWWPMSVILALRR